MQQDVDKALNAGINAMATILHPEEKETWYHPRTEYEEDKLIQQERTLRIKDPCVAMWVDRAFDMGINFSDIFRRINKVNPDFWNNCYRGAWIDRPQYYETHVEGKTPITEAGGEDRVRRMRIEQRAAHQDNKHNKPVQADDNRKTNRHYNGTTYKRTGNDERQGRHHPPVAKQTNQPKRSQANQRADQGNGTYRRELGLSSSKSNGSRSKTMEPHR
jgi:hypothetical protein